MQITIDTKKDSPEEIKKAIQLLSVLVQGKARHSNIFEDDSSTPPPQPDPIGGSGDSGNAFANLFGNTPPPAPSPEKQEEKKESPSVILY